MFSKEQALAQASPDDANIATALTNLRATRLPWSIASAEVTEAAR